MKTKKFSKMLELNKRTVANLNLQEMNSLHAGDAVHSVGGYTCALVTSVVWVETADSRLNCGRELCAELQEIQLSYPANIVK